MSNKKHIWHDHKGEVVSSNNSFDVIDCELCKFKHIVPIPVEKELTSIYEDEYYSKEKPLYLEQYSEDADWWEMVYNRRYDVFETYLNSDTKRLLDIGSGPGHFLLSGKNRGWQVKGIEPSLQAVEYSNNLGLDIIQGYYSTETALELNHFDAINMSLVLEHTPDPASVLSLVHDNLNNEGMLCVVVPNDFNPFQLVARDHLNFEPWWVSPPHHINYFNFNSLEKLLERCGFEIIHKEASFPIDMFLLMGDNYIENNKLGRECHQKRKTLELNLINGGMKEVMNSFSQHLASSGIGREVILFARKKK